MSLRDTVSTGLSVHTVAARVHASKLSPAHAVFDRAAKAAEETAKALDEKTGASEKAAAAAAAAKAKATELDEQTGASEKAAAAAAVAKAKATELDEKLGAAIATAEEGVPPTIKLLVVAATGGLGSAITRHAVSAGHDVSIVVRSADGLADKLHSAEVAESLTNVIVGDATDPAILAGAVKGMDAVAVAVGAQAKAVVENAVNVVAAVADTQPALVMVGGSPALAMEDGSSAVEGAFGGAEWAQSLRDLHLGVTFAALEASTVERFCMVCPGTMAASDDGKPTGVHGFRPNVIDPTVAGDTATYDDVAVGFVGAAVDLVKDAEASPYKKGKLALTVGGTLTEDK